MDKSKVILIGFVCESETVNSSWALAAAKSTQNWIRHFECIMATWQQ
jgi:hypothetical protein